MRVAFMLLISALAAAQEAPRHGHGDKYGNPPDLESYIASLGDPARDAWQKPDEVVRALGLGPGQSACDIGSGPGYFTLRLAKAVGATGRVWAVDVEPVILAALRDRLESAGVVNVTPILAATRDPLLPAAACDVVLIVNTYHHFHDGPAYLRRLTQSLKPGGRIVNIDYKKEAGVSGPPLPHRISRDEFVRDAGQAGLESVQELALLARQYFVILAPRGN
jgi:ubiquinone/menaquinone biosynthesis C-methylase UbiE